MAAFGNILGIPKAQAPADSSTTQLSAASRDNFLTVRRVERQQRIVELLGAAPRREALAILVDRGVRLPDALALAAAYRQEGRAVSVVRRSGKLGAQLGRLEEWDFTSFVYLRDDWTPQTAVEERPLGATAT